MALARPVTVMAHVIPKRNVKIKARKIIFYSKLK